MTSETSTATRQTLTVLVVTRDHEGYIAEALESIHAQEGILIDRLIISDDHSTDRTAEVARETLAKLGMDGEVRESAEQMGITPHYEKLFKGLDTDLVAVLEGDDYWFDRRKLQRQAAALHHYPHASACTMRYLLYYQESNSLVGKSFNEGGLSVLSTEDMIKGGDGFGFSNMMYRVEALRTIPDAFYALKSYDWIANILVSRTGPIVLLDLPGVVHRITSKGAWAGLDLAGQLETLGDAIESYIPHSDEHTAALFEAKLAEVRAQLTLLSAPAPVSGPPSMARRAKSAIKRRVKRMLAKARGMESDSDA